MAYVVAAAVIVAALAAGYSAYSASEAQAQQYSAAKKAARLKAEQEAAAGEARVNQIEYEANKRRKSMLSRQAAAGVQIGEGSLLETMQEFEADVSYSKQLAKYPHQQAGFSDEYEATLFGYGQDRANRAKYVNAGVAAGSTLATGYMSNSKAINNSLIGSSDPV